MADESRSNDDTTPAMVPPDVEPVDAVAAPNAGSPSRRRRGVLILLVLALLLVVGGAGLWWWRQGGGPAAPADSATLIPRDALFSLPTHASPTLSPDGRQVAWLGPAEGQPNLFVAAVIEPGNARQLTRFSDSSVDAVSWSADGQRLLFIVNSLRGDDAWQLMVHDLKGGKNRTLLTGTGARPLVVAASAAQPDALLLGLARAESPYRDLYRLDLATGKRTLVLANDRYDGFVADAALAVRVVQQAVPTGGFLWRRPEGGGFVPFAQVPAEDALTTALVGLSNDGATLFARDSRDGDTSRLVAIDVASGRLTPLTEAPAAADVEDVVIDPATDRPVLAAIEGATRRWQALDQAYAADAAVLSTLAPQVAVLDVSNDGKAWLLAADDGARPTRFYLYRRGGQPVLLFSLRDLPAKSPIARTVPVTVPLEGGLQATGYLTPAQQVPVDADGLPRAAAPLVMLVHGGPWTRDRLGWLPTHQWLANRGYTVLSVNYRGSAGFGKAYLAAADNGWASIIPADIEAGAAWAVARGYARRDKVALIGASFGGYAALMGLASQGDRYACAVASHPPVDLVKLADGVAPADVATYDLIVNRVGDPTTQEGRTALAAASPVNRADSIGKPLLLAIGGRDRAALEPDLMAFAQKLAAAGKPVTAAVFVGEAGGYDRPDNERAFLGLTEAFLGACLGGRAEPIAPALLMKSEMRVPVGADNVPGLRTALMGGPTPTKE